MLVGWVIGSLASLVVSHSITSFGQVRRDVESWFVILLVNSQAVSQSVGQSLTSISQSES